MGMQFEDSWELILKSAMKLRDYFAASSCNSKSDVITFSQEKLLTVVMDNPEGMMLKDIANILGLTPGAVSQTLDVLVREEILERVPAPHDRRAILIRPTEKSHALQARFSQRFHRIMSLVKSKTTEEERKNFIKVLQTVFENIETQNAASIRRIRSEGELLEEKA